MSSVTRDFAVGENPRRTRCRSRRGGRARGADTHVADALRPDGLVELDVHAHIRGLHGLLGELLHLLERERGGRGTGGGERKRDRMANASMGPVGNPTTEARGRADERVGATSTLCKHRWHHGASSAANARPARAPGATTRVVVALEISRRWDGTHRSHRTGSPLLEGDPVDRLGEVDGVFARDDILRLTHGCKRLVYLPLRAFKRDAGRRRAGVKPFPAGEREKSSSRSDTSQICQICDARMYPRVKNCPFRGAWLAQIPSRAKIPRRNAHNRNKIFS